MITNSFATTSPTRRTFSEPYDYEPLRATPATAFRRTEEGPALLGESPAIRHLRSQVERIAPYFRTALIRGEAGTGKQSIARAIHARSPSARGPFIVSDATSLAEAIVAGTAASLVDFANGGTLYLESAGELPFPLQAALSRFLRMHEERRATAGASRGDWPRLDIRILVATHRDLRTLSAIGQFSPELYRQLSAVEIYVPPLRQRVEDIAALAVWLLRRLADRAGQPSRVLGQATLAQLEDRVWPNNLRELDRVIAQAAALAEGPTIEPRHLLSLVEPAGAHAPAAPATLERLEDVIQQHVLAMLTRCGGNKLRAAELLGISRSTLYRMLETNSVAPRNLPR